MNTPKHTIPVPMANSAGHAWSKPEWSWCEAAHPANDLSPNPKMTSTAANVIVLFIP